MSDESSLASVIESRLERLSGGSSWGCEGTVSQFAALEAAGFTPAGQVFGATVLRLGVIENQPRCTGSRNFTPRSDLASAGGPFSALLRRLNGARRRALDRAVDECVALGGDGIVSARLAVTTVEAGVMEFSVTGTAVRARSSIRPAEPFTAHVSGQELARLLEAGWMPFSVVFGVAIATRHDGAGTRQQTRIRRGAAGNQEVRSYSHLVNDTRRDARKQVGEAVSALGGEGVVVDEMTLSISERECPTNEGESDHVARAAIHGTALVTFAGAGRTGPRPPLTIMRLNPAAPLEKRAGLGVPAVAAEEPDQEELAVPETRLVDRMVARNAAWRRKRDPFTNDYQNNRNSGE